MLTLLFDVDDTLCDQTWPFREAARERSLPEGLDLAAVFAASRQYSDEVFLASVRGEITMEEMYIYRVKHALADFGVKITDAEALDFQKVYAAAQKSIRLSPVMEELLRGLMGRAKLGVVTNGPAAHQWEKVTSLGLTRFIPRENILVSGDLGTAKPERKIFELALERLGARREETIFVGDSLVNDIAGAQGAGLRALWINRHGQSEDGFAPNYKAESEEELAALLLALTE